MLSWMLHRITGVGLLVFISAHILASFFSQQTGSALANSINALYQSWGIQLLLMFFVIFHVLNGLRVAIMDLWPKLQSHLELILWLEWAIVLTVFGGVAVSLILRVIGGG